MIDGSTDVRTLASQFVAVERAPMDNLLRKQQSYYQSRLKAFESIASGINAFRNVLGDLKEAGSLKAFSATTSADGYLQVNAGANAAPGRYAVNVKQLATAHQLALGFDSEDVALPASGGMELSLAGEAFSIDFAALGEGATVADLRDAINAAADNSGVRASLVRSNGSVLLLLTSEDTGAANMVSVSLTSVDAGNELAAAVDNRVTLSEAQDAEIALGTTAPITITSASNTLEDVFDGITITLTRAHTDPGERLEINIARDEEATREQLGKFVEAYNSLVDLMKRHTVRQDGNDPVLAGDSTARLLVQQLRNQFNDLPGGITLGSIGIQADRYGKLSLDNAVLADFLAANPDGLTSAFGGGSGLMEKLDALLKPFVSGNNSVIDSRADSMQAGLDRISDRQLQLDERMTKVYNRYLAQFTNMQNLVMQMQQTFNMFV